MKDTTKESSKALALFTQLAISMIVPIFLCLLLGRWLDNIFHTGGILLIIFLILGIAAGFRSIYYLVRSFWKDKDSYIDMNEIKNRLQNENNTDKEDNEDESNDF